MDLIIEYGFLFVLGLAFGSFITVVVERFDTAESFFTGRSHCNHCDTKLTWWELLPVVSYVILRGKCYRCKKIIPHIYPLFELITGLCFVGIRFGMPEPVNYWVLVFYILFVSILLALCFYDWINQAFPSFFLLVALVAIVVIDIVLMILKYPGLNTHVTFAPFTILSSPAHIWAKYLVGAAVGAGMLGLLAFPTKGKWMGYGDVILAGILGFWLGYPFIIIGIMLAFYLGSIVGVTMLFMRRLNRDHRIAFGPFLVFGSIATQIWGTQLFKALMRLWGVI